MANIIKSLKKSTKSEYQEAEFSSIQSSQHKTEGDRSDTGQTEPAAELPAFTT
jgi:hypothetical protein